MDEVTLPDLTVTDNFGGILYVISKTLTMGFLRSHLEKLFRWILSSVSYWRSLTKRWSPPGISRSRRGLATLVVISELAQ